MKIGIIVTTFLRNDLLECIIASILSHWKNEYILFIGNQGNIDEKHLKYLKNTLDLGGFIGENSDLSSIIDPISQQTKKDALIAYNDRIQYYSLPYDCGLSYARNFLFNRAKEADCQYVFLTADSYEFKDYNLNPIIAFLESSPYYGLVGFVEEKKPDPRWCWDMELIPNDCFELFKPKRPKIEFQDLKFQPCDITQNFYLAKTTMVTEIPHDNELKLTEHEDIMYRFKQSGWKVFFNDSIACIYVNDKPQEYNEKRRRIYNIYKKKLQEKYKIRGWIKIRR